MKSIIFFFFLVFSVTGIATLWTGLDFPFEVLDKQSASYLCFIIAGILLIIFYILRVKKG
ncbi:hypothetical protein [Bacillus massilinigeriensis]|uniref:hypothetical protein n=1 Tax=Bacillus mediterraneensis TaxID=1805474 RepID=UPI0008F94B58|nr:hypothetical protein [Bacillus mediterraneensis]